MEDFNTIGSWVDNLSEGLPEGLLADLKVNWEVDQIVSGWIQASEDFEPKFDEHRYTNNCTLTASHCPRTPTWGCKNTETIN